MAVLNRHSFPSPLLAEPVSMGLSSKINASLGPSARVHVANLEQPLLVLFEEGEQHIVELIADVLGQSWKVASQVADAFDHDDGTVVGLAGLAVSTSPQNFGGSMLLLYAHCADGRPPDEELRRLCQYEYIYTNTKYLRRDLTRFLSFILGQASHLQDFGTRPWTNELCLTFPDVNAALPNLEILCVGADSIEFRVDLLKEPSEEATGSSVPSLQYVGEQLQALRQRSELPIIFTTRCTNENGRFPMDDPDLFYIYLNQAIKWGVEYIDVELWLPEDIRTRLSQGKGHSKIISAFHDFSGCFKWTSPDAERLFLEGAAFGDVVKMIALAKDMQDNDELEYFRSMIDSKYHSPPFSGLNMGPIGQPSRPLNKIFTPITHPLLCTSATPGQLSAAEINSALHSMGSLRRLDIYGLGKMDSGIQPAFFEKCFNELNLPHRFLLSERVSKETVDTLTRKAAFGGACLSPPLPTTALTLASYTDAARAIGQIDTIKCGQREGANFTVGANVTWKGIRATLSRDLVPSAYQGRSALILASAEADAAAAIYALKSLGMGPIYTIGFEGTSPLAEHTTPVRGFEEMRMLEHPFVIMSALPSKQSILVGSLLRYYGAPGRREGATSGKVFVDLADGIAKHDLLTMAGSFGWSAYNIDDIRAWITVETIRILFGQNLGFDFARCYG